MKLQDAYVSESNAVGDWSHIGYKMAESTNFTYEDKVENYSDAGTISLTASGNVGNTWYATNKPAMNDCTAKNCHWTLTLKGDGKGNGIVYTAKAGDPMLTPSFELIGK